MWSSSKLVNTQITEIKNNCPYTKQATERKILPRTVTGRRRQRALFIKQELVLDKGEVAEYFTRTLV